MASDSPKTQVHQPVTCIVPFYNEGKRVLSVLSILSEVSNLDSIICVDDGSHDTVYRKIRELFPEVLILRHKKNRGKAEAIQTALSAVTTDYVMLLDADLAQLYSHEIEQAISTVQKDPLIDMLVFRNVNETWYCKALRGDVLTSGQRILLTSDLKRIYKTKPKNYQIELAINSYMMKHVKNVYWVVYSGKNVTKPQKIGILKGWMEEFKMYSSMFEYAGYKSYVKSYFTFCVNQYPDNDGRSLQKYAFAQYFYDIKNKLEF